MLRIGAGWVKTSDKGNEYISIGIAKELLKNGLTITEKTYLSLHLNDKKEQTEHPDYVLCLSIAEDKKE